MLSHAAINGTATMMENWHGVSGEAPAARMDELLTVLKALWKLHEGPVHHDGRFYRVHVTPTADVPEPVRPAIPIWIAGVNKLMLRTAGAGADGLVGHPMFTAAYVGGPVADELADCFQGVGFGDLVKRLKGKIGLGQHQVGHANDTAMG